MKERRRSILTDDDIKKLSEVFRNSIPLSRDQDQKFFGFKIKDLILIVGVFMSIYAFYIRTNDTLEKLTKISESFLEFSKNSDSYHSALTGAQFNQGKPASYKFLSSFRKTNSAQDKGAEE